MSGVLQLFYLHREVYEQGKKAFVSFVHFYYKHECKLIFQAKGEPTVPVTDALIFLLM